MNSKNFFSLQVIPFHLLLLLKLSTALEEALYEETPRDIAGVIVQGTLSIPHSHKVSPAFAASSEYPGSFPVSLPVQRTVMTA